MANNALVFNAALQGATGGAATRWLTKQSQADYDAIAAQIVEFATAVDAEIPAEVVTESDAELMSLICNGVMNSRWPGSLTALGLVNIAKATEAMWRRLRSELEPVVPAASSPVYVADYLFAAGGDLRLAMIAAQAANTSEGITFVMPNGTYSWTPGTTFQPRNNTIWSCYGCNIELDVGGVATGQQFIFLRIDAGVGTHPDRIQVWGGRFRILNVLTSFFSAAVQFEASSNCVIKDATAEATFDAAATQGRIRWGFNLLGGDQTVDITQGRNNRFENCTLKFAQIQGCGAGRSADGVSVINTQVDDANDLAISVVSGGATQSLQNVSIDGVQCRNIGGNGVVLAGTDGAGAGIGCGVLRNLFVNNIQLDGERSTPNLDFTVSTVISINGGLVTENVVVSNIGTKLAPNASLQARSVSISSQDDEVSWTGLAISNCELGVVTSNDPLEALFISGRTIKGVTINNVTVHGVRGVRITDCDGMTINNLGIRNGTLLMLASSRNLTDGINITNCNIKRTTGFNTTLQFTSTAARSVSGVTISNCRLEANGNAGIGVSLGGGTMSMELANIDNVSNVNPSAETLNGITRAVNIRGFIVTTIVSVAVPAVAAGVVAYVDVSMVGTRLADLAVGEAIVVNPQADLIAAGAGGGIVSTRVSAVGTVRIGFSGTANAAVNHSFARAA